MEDITNELLSAIVRAPAERKRHALQVLLDQTPPAAPATGPFLLTMGKAAKLLGVSRSTLYRMVISGTIQPVEIRRGTYRVRRADIEALARDGIVTVEGGAA